MLARLLAIGLGVLVTFHWALPVGVDVRLTDLAIAYGFAAIALQLLRGRALDRSATAGFIVLVLALCGAATEVALMGSRHTTAAMQFVMLRVILSVFAGYQLAQTLNSRQTRVPAALGMAAGLLFGLISVYIDQATFSPTDLDPGMDPAMVVYLNGEYRPKGIFSHPNAAAAALCLVFPIFVGLLDERRLPRLAMLFPVAIVGATFAATQSRSPLINCLVVAGVWTLTRVGRRSGVAVAVTVALTAAAGAGLIFATGGASVFGTSARFNNVESMLANIRDRLATTGESLYLVLTHPLGTGSGYQRMLEAKTGFGATHNAYVELGLLFGWPLLLFVAIRLWMMAFGHARRPMERWLALYLALAFFFENLFALPSITIITLALVIGGFAFRPSGDGRSGFGRPWAQRRRAASESDAATAP